MVKINPTYSQVIYILNRYELVSDHTAINESYTNDTKRFYYTCTRTTQGHIETFINELLAVAIKQDKLISHLIK